ncbi:hypothetical protein B0H14DRAFT_2646318 [Mycena olivaceomarginata]|nr:hypothetical protein B0H14DRAFT_2646318 [Mycena olivaceomarginata]
MNYQVRGSNTIIGMCLIAFFGGFRQFSLFHMDFLEVGMREILRELLLGNFEGTVGKKTLQRGITSQYGHVTRDHVGQPCLSVRYLTSFMWLDDVGDQYGPLFIIYHCLNPHFCAADSTLSYSGGDDPDSKFQCLLGHLPAFQMTWLGRISNTTSAISMESNSTRLSSSPMPGGISSTAMSPTHIREHFQASHRIMGCYIKCCIHYHKTLDFQKLCKTHVYGVQVDQGEQTACTCKNHTFTSMLSMASSLSPVSHPVTDINFNQQHTIYTSYTLNTIRLVLLYLPCIEVRFSKK